MSMMNMTGGGRVGKPITYFVRGDLDDDDDGDDDDGDDDDDFKYYSTTCFTHYDNSRCFVAIFLLYELLGSKSTNKNRWLRK